MLPRILMKRHTYFICAVIGLLLEMTCIACHAEFLKTGVGVFQSTKRRAKIIVSQEEPGIFIVFGDEIDLQVFDPTELKKDQAAHLFVRFDPSINRYVALLVGSKEYRIVGNLSLLVEGVASHLLRVTIDNANPYLTVVVEGTGNEAEILGFLGLNAVVNNNGQEAVALLEANQLSELKGVVDPYRLKAGEITVKDRPVAGLALGITQEVRNPCLEKGAMVLLKSEIAVILDPKLDRADSKRRLGEAIQRSRSNPPLRGLLKLRIGADSIIALDPLKATILLIHETRLSGPGRKICSIEEITLGSGKAR